MANQVLRTIYIDPDIDDELRTEAFDTRRSKNDILNEYLKFGMDVAREERRARREGRKTPRKMQAELTALQAQVKALLETVDKLVG